MGLTEKQKEEVQSEILKCKARIKNDLQSTAIDVQELTSRLDKMEEYMESSFKKHELQRTNFNEILESKVDELREWFAAHDEKEMNTYKEILTSVKSLADTMEDVIQETRDNSNYISKKAHEDNIQDEVDKRLKKINKPKEDRWEKIRMTAISVFTIGAIGALGTGVWFIINLYIAMGMGK